MVAMDNNRAGSYFHHVRGIEQTFKTADAIMEEIESDMQYDSEETDSDDDEEDVE
jgi:hypothetical protein